MQRLWRLFAVCLLGACVAVLVTACGGSPRSSHTTTTIQGTTTVPKATIAQRCPLGQAFMGCSIGASPTFSLTPPTGIKVEPLPAGITKAKEFPDVSNYQGCSLDWPKIAGAGAVVKLGEGSSIVDACASHNIAGLRAAGKRFAVYWFVRPGSINSEAAYIVAALKAHGLTISHVVIYTAPGTWPGGSSAGLPTWEAAYGEYRPALPFTARVLAWQYTDGQYGSPTYIAGLGYGDVSVDYGLLKLSPHALVLDDEVPDTAGYVGPLASYVLKHDAVPKPKTYSCKPFKAQRSRRACDALRRQERHFEQEIEHQRKVLRSGHCYAHRRRGKCVAELKRGDQEHAALARLLKTSHVQP